MRLAPEGNIIVYPLFIILLFTCGYGYVFDFESIFVFRANARIIHLIRMSLDPLFIRLRSVEPKLPTTKQATPAKAPVQKRGPASTWQPRSQGAGTPKPRTKATGGKGGN